MTSEAHNITITADSGSTKTTWRIEDGAKVTLLTTQGINPFHQKEEHIRQILYKDLQMQTTFPPVERVSRVLFYGAGCTKEKSPLLKEILSEAFPHATVVEVDSDMLGAAKALFGNNEGIACILGTGANSCLYDGRRIVANISPLGYILGDEGSGAVLGKTFLNVLYKGDHRDFIGVFERESGLTMAEVVQRVYREPMPNRFLASLAPFIKEHLNEAWIEALVEDCFRLFFRRNVAHYSRPDLPCSFVGSIAFHFSEQLRKAAEAEGYAIGTIIKEPLAIYD